MARTILKDSNTSWNRVPYQVRFGAQFKTMADSLAWSTGIYGPSFEAAMKQATGDPSFNIDLRTLKTEYDGESDAATSWERATGAPLYLGRSFYKDTRLGANDAINCLWQFNRDDDIVHPMLRSTVGAAHAEMSDVLNLRKAAHYIGEGRVYASTIEQNQSLLWLSFGVARFTALDTFFMNSVRKELATINNVGPNDDTSLIGNIFGKIGEWTGRLALIIPVGFVQGMRMALNRGSEYYVNKFYSMMPTMYLYYTFVDSILSKWLVSTGLVGNSETDTARESAVRAMQESSSGVGGGSSTPNPSDMSGLSGDGTATTNSEVDEWWKSAYSKGADGSLSGGIKSAHMFQPEYTAMPFILQEAPSIWQIVTRKARTLGFGMDHPKTKEDIVDQDIGDIAREMLSNSAGAKSPWWTGQIWRAETDATEAAAIANADLNNNPSFWDVFRKTSGGATNFVAFRIEKSVDASESFSNSTAPSSVAEQINNAARTAMTHKYEWAMQQGELLASNGPFGQLVNGLWASAQTAWQTLTEGLGMADVATITTGGAFIDMPESYRSSDFNKSHSISFQLRSPYGDITSIYQSIIVPLAMILAGALPRAAGQNSYTQPFLVKAYCKGLFSVPLGIIESVSVKRGSDEFGWTYTNLPTCVDVSISIKDMSPVMYMGMNDSVYTNIMPNESNFDEYIYTLAGLGMWERISYWESFKRHWAYKVHTIGNRLTNPAWYGLKLGDTKLAKLVGVAFSNCYISNSK